jgi:hypothetical protein
MKSKNSKLKSIGIGLMTVIATCFLASGCAKTSAKADDTAMLVQRAERAAVNAENAVTKAEDAAIRAENAADRAERMAEKSERIFTKKMKK